MNDIFDFLSDNHFGETYDKLYKEVCIGESVVISGMPGAGVQYLMKFSEKKLIKEFPEAHILFLRGALIQENALEIIKKNIFEFSNTNNLSDALQYFNRSNKLFLLIDSFQYVKNIEEVLEFLTILRKNSVHNIINIIGVDYTFLDSLKDYFDKNYNAFSAVLYLPPYDLAGTKEI